MEFLRAVARDVAGKRYVKGPSMPAVVTELGGEAGNGPYGGTTVKCLVRVR